MNKTMGNKKSDKKTHVCPHEGCTSAFNRPYRLAQHLLVHNNVKAFACPEENCTKAYTNKSHLDRHINKTHRQCVKEEVVYPCPICFKKYSNRQNLKRHVNSKHAKVFICDICKEEFKKKHLLSGHMYKHTGVKAFSCDYCEKKFVFLSEKTKHLINHQTHKCPHCDIKLNDWSRFKQHVKSHIIKNEFTCEPCGRVFEHRVSITQHMKTHDEARARVFLCPYENCNRFYSRNSNLKQHIAMKHEMIRHGCHLCSATLCTKAKLQQHIQKIHESERKPRVYKTKAMGRKVRKDCGVPRSSTIHKLGGLPSKLEIRDVLPMFVETVLNSIEGDQQIGTTVNQTDHSVESKHDPQIEIYKFFDNKHVEQIQTPDNLVDNRQCQQIVNPDNSVDSKIVEQTETDNLIQLSDLVDKCVQQIGTPDNLVDSKHVQSIVTDNVVDSKDGQQIDSPVNLVKKEIKVVTVS